MQNKIKVSDLIAEFLEEKNITHVFGIIGAGNAHIFDSISNRNFTKIICVHHEQAAVMAMVGYFRATGKACAVLLTTGAGSTNAVTGVVSAWMDSVPGLIIAGNENLKYIGNDLRIWGVQGYDSISMINKVTKYSERVLQSEDVINKLNSAFDTAFSPRFGPAWLEIPMSIQSALLSKSDLIVEEKKQLNSLLMDDNFELKLNSLKELLLTSKKPVLWLGHGIRLSGAHDLVEDLVDRLNIPVILSWAGLDLMSFDHKLNFGSAGVYGGRAANFIVQNSDLLITIGTRLAIPQIGYEITEFARNAKIVMNDIDPKEVNKVGSRVNLSFLCDSKIFIKHILNNVEQISFNMNESWLQYCNKLRIKYPKVGIEHEDKNGYINSYRFMFEISKVMENSDIIVTDMGTALLSGHQALNISKGQRIFTSTGLGEMGFGLPAAIGSSIALENKKIICFNCDGGMMLNLQEMQTMVHHKLPIKLFIFNNDGYLMIKHTQKSLFKGRYTGTETKSGVTCPNYKKIAHAFSINYAAIRTWDDFENNISEILLTKEAYICEIFMDPEQPLVPKLSLALQQDGTLVSPPLEDLSPIVSRSEFRDNMLIEIHPKSINLV